MYVPLYLSWNEPMCYFKPWLCLNHATNMNCSVKAIEWFEPMTPVESSKKWNAFSGCWCGMGFHHHSQSLCWPAPIFTQVLDLLLCICNHIQRVWLIHNRVVLLGETKSFHISMSVKTLGHLSNKMFDDAEFLMTMNVCEEQLSHFLVFLMISF